MFRYGLVCSLETLTSEKLAVYQGPLAAYAKMVSAIGYDAIELHLRNPRQYDAVAMKRTAADAGLSFCALSTGLEYSLNGLCFTSSDKNIREKTSIRFKEHIDLDAKLNAVVFLGLCRGKAPNYSHCELYLNRLAAELVPIASYAQTKNVILAFEPIVFYLTNLLNKTEETLEFLKRPGLENIQVLLDTHHMFIECIIRVKNEWTWTNFFCPASISIQLGFKHFFT